MNPFSKTQVFTNTKRVVTFSINLIILFCLIFLFPIPPLNALDNSELITFIAQFSKEETEKTISSKTTGIVYLDISDKLWVVVKEPVNQFVFLTTDKMTIYYPDRNIAYFISSSQIGSFLFLTPFVASLRGDYGYSDQGFKLKDHVFSGDTLITRWNPPKNLEKKMGISIVKTLEDDIIQVINLDPDGEMVQRMEFSDFRQITDIFRLPYEVCLVNDTKEIKRIVKLDNVQINTTIPDSVCSFRIPKNAEVNKIKW